MRHLYLVTIRGGMSVPNSPQALGSYFRRPERGPGTDLPERLPLRLLLSYFYFSKIDIAEMLDECFAGVDIELDVFADSGAYSAHTLGKPVEPDDYIAWVKRWEGRFTCAAGPDVIGDPVATHRETVRMRRVIRNIPVLPTFHVGEDWSWLLKAVKVSDYIALGGMVPYSANRRLLTVWLQQAFSMIPATMRVHGFGMTTWSLLRRFPWYSVDSSSWTAGFRYANAVLFDERLGKFVVVNMRSKQDLFTNTALLRSYGLIASRSQAASYDRSLLCYALCQSWRRAERWLDKPIFLVCNGVTDFERLKCGLLKAVT